MKRILLVASLTLAISPLLAQNDLSVGTWKLNVAKSQYKGTPPPKSETRTLVAEGNGYKVTYEGIAADGSQIGYSFTTYLDGKDAPISGAGPFGADTVAVKRVDAYTMTGIVKKAGKEIRTTTTVVSKDGKITTQTVKGINEQGQAISYTMIWEKQ
jgi:hypothetical protein